VTLFPQASVRFFAHDAVEFNCLGCQAQLLHRLAYVVLSE
jgi:hypothetical protein